jgi:opacity protein-like surface antigen
MANFLLRYPRGRIYPFAGVGIGFSWAEINANVLEESDNALAWQLITGINYEILPNWSADLAYRYLNSRYENENVDAKDENHAIVLGVNYHF